MNQPLTLTAAQKAGPKLTAAALGVVLAILLAMRCCTCCPQTTPFMCRPTP